MNTKVNGHPNKVHFRHFYMMPGKVIHVNETTEADCYEYSRIAIQTKARNPNPMI